MLGTRVKGICIEYSENCVQLKTQLGEGMAVLAAHIIKGAPNMLEILLIIPSCIFLKCYRLFFFILVSLPIILVLFPYIPLKPYFKDIYCVITVISHREKVLGGYNWFITTC